MSGGLKAIIIGAGIGGLATAIYLAQRGVSVRVFEAGPTTGGLASGFTLDGFSFDYGPYILLDRPGLEWAFHQLGEELANHVELTKIEDIYEVGFPNDVKVSFHSDLEHTAAEFEKQWPGSARKYIEFVHRTDRIYQRLSELQHVSHPRLADMLASGAWKEARFLLSSLQQVLARTGLPEEIVNAVGIWTHVAGQNLHQAPSPLALVPSLFHTVGSYCPRGGIRRIAEVLTQLALNSGVQFELNRKIKKICSEGNRVTAVQTEDGEFHPAQVIVSNHSAIGTYLDLLDQPIGKKNELEKLQLQSPGVCAYLAVKNTPRPPYLRFRLTDNGEPCRLLINPGLLAPEEAVDGWYPARLLSPMRYADAERGTEDQRQYLGKILAENWWRPVGGEFRVLATQIPAEWSSRFNLYRASMNPVMTAKFMRAGRMPHRSPYFQGLYFAGSSTHPGQWVSFCSISGVLAAKCLLEDARC
jgi:phytoene dehydrogenase-like protein